MSGAASSLLFAFANLFHPRILWLMVWPVAIAVALWGGVMLVLWAQLVAWLVGLIREYVLSASILASFDLSGAAMFAAKVLLLIALVPLIQLTALLILGVFGMPAMVNHVAQKAFPALARRQGGSFAGSIWNSVVAVLGLIGLGLISVPFLFVPPLWPILPILVMGWVNQRVLRYDALAEHADPVEMHELFRANGLSLYLLGMVLALIAYIPFLGFLAPVVFGLTFIHYLLGKLQAMRALPIEGEVLRDTPLLGRTDDRT